MSKTILIIVIALIVMVGGYFLFKGGYSVPEPTPQITPSPQISSGGIKEFSVSGTEFALNPSTITVTTGDRVRIIFKNDGNFSHNWVVEGAGIATKTIGPGQTDAIEFTAPAAGKYTTYCSVVFGAVNHRERGMVGTLIVEPVE